MNKTLSKIAQKLDTTQSDIDHISKDVSATLETLTATKKDNAEKEGRETLKKVIKWLSVTDPSSNLQAASGKHEPGTGQWLLDGIRFREWKRTKKSFMWLYGIRKYIKFNGQR